MTLILYPITLAAVGLTACVLALLTNRAQFGTLWATLEDLARPNRYTGGHRAGGRATWRHMLVTRARTARSRAARAAYLALMVVPQPADDDGLDEWIAAMHTVQGDEVGTAPAGELGRYAHLRPDELDSTAERFMRIVDKGLRPPSQWGTPVEVDEWDLAVSRG